MIARGLAGPARPLALFLVLVAGAVAVEAVLLIGSPQAPYWTLMTLPGTGLVYAVVGALAWVRRPSNGMGALFCAGAVVWLVSGLVNTDYPAFIAAGQLVATVPVAIVLHALLAFPSGRLTTRPARTLAALGYLVTTVVLAPQYLFTPLPAPYDPLFVADRPDVLAVLNPAVNIVVGALVLATAVVLVHRLATGAAGTRRTLGPVYAYGAVAVVGVWGALHVLRWLHVSALVLPLVQILLLAGVPVAFVAGVLRGGFARTQELRELATTLGRDPAGRAELGRALARTLGDPSARVLFRVPAPADSDDWVDASGTTVGQPGTVAPARRSRWATGRSGPSTTTARCSPTTRRCAPRAGSSPSPWTTSGSPSSCWPGAHSCGSPGCACSKQATGSGGASPRTCTTGCRAGWSCSRSPPTGRMGGTRCAAASTRRSTSSAGSSRG
jgi:hypothetical protein